jgi:hypothetical protein
VNRSGLGFVVFVVAIFVMLWAGARPACGSPGSSCSRQSDCGRHEVCVADSYTSDRGHCVAIRVLP